MENEQDNLPYELQQDLVQRTIGRVIKCGKPFKSVKVNAPYEWSSEGLAVPFVLEGQFYVIHSKTTEDWKTEGELYVHQFDSFLMQKKDGERCMHLKARTHVLELGPETRLTRSELQLEVLRREGYDLPRILQQPRYQGFRATSDSEPFLDAPSTPKQRLTQMLQMAEGKW